MTYREDSTFWLPYNSLAQMQLASANNPLYGADMRDQSFDPGEHFLKFSQETVEKKTRWQESGQLPLRYKNKRVVLIELPGMELR